MRSRHTMAVWTDAVMLGADGCGSNSSGKLKDMGSEMLIFLTHLTTLSFTLDTWKNIPGDLPSVRVDWCWSLKVC